MPKATQHPTLLTTIGAIKPSLSTALHGRPDLRRVVDRWLDSGVPEPLILACLSIYFNAPTRTSLRKTYLMVLEQLLPGFEELRQEIKSASYSIWRIVQSPLFAELLRRIDQDPRRTLPLRKLKSRFHRRGTDLIPEHLVHAEEWLSLAAKEIERLIRIPIADRKLSVSRALVWLFLSGRHAFPAASDYRLHKDIEHLLVAANLARETGHDLELDHKTVAIRINRFRKTRPKEFEWVGERLRTAGVPNPNELIQFVYFSRPLDTD